MLFADGVSSETIILYFEADNDPELEEESQVRLIQVLQNGVPEGGDMSRGAAIVQGEDIAFITVSANDAPHGVIVWSVVNVSSTEVEGQDSNLTLTLIREFGTIGSIVISFRLVRQLVNWLPCPQAAPIPSVNVHLSAPFSSLPALRLFFPCRPMNEPRPTKTLFP